MLMPALKGYFVAAKATQEGVQLPEASKARARPADMGRGGMSWLALKEKGLLSPGKLADEVTEAEIVVHIAQNQLLYKMSTPDRAARTARQRIAAQRLKQKREDFIKDLRSDAKIEIVDERFM